MPLCLSSSVPPCLRALGAPHVRIFFHNEYVRWLEIAVNDSFLVGVLHGVSDACDQFKAMPNVNVA